MAIERCKRSSAPRRLIVLPNAPLSAAFKRLLAQIEEPLVFRLVNDPETDYRNGAASGVDQSTGFVSC